MGQIHGELITNVSITKVTSTKRTVVTVNLNMKEKENLKLNIFMNKVLYAIIYIYLVFLNVVCFFFHKSLKH